MCLSLGTLFSILLRLKDVEISALRTVGRSFVELSPRSHSLVLAAIQPYSLRRLTVQLTANIGYTQCQVSFVSRRLPGSPTTRQSVGQFCQSTWPSPSPANSSFYRSQICCTLNVADSSIKMSGKHTKLSTDRLKDILHYYQL